MSELTNTLLNLRSLRVLSRDLTLVQLQEARDKLTIVVQERQESEKELRAAQAERETKLAEITKQIAQDGLNVEDLINALSNHEKKGKREPRPAKYKYTDVDGKEKTWTGQGRTPSVIQAYLNEGGALDDFLI